MRWLERQNQIEAAVYDVMNELKNANFGISTAIGIGRDMVVGFDFIDLLKIFYYYSSVNILITSSITSFCNGKFTCE